MVIPGRREASSPESITTSRKVTHRAVQEPRRLWLWVPGSRAFSPRPGMTYAAFCFAGSSRSVRRRILPTGVFGSSLRNSMNFGRL
jgi:hypothetical protein